MAGKREWRPARCIVAFRDLVDRLWPKRSKDSDGTIGDERHKTGDHVPDAAGIVHAIDITNDPANGVDIESLAEALRESRDERIQYVIANRQIFSSTVQPWQWRTYGGSDPHTNHLHMSVVRDARADDPSGWNIGAIIPSAPAPLVEDGDFGPLTTEALQRALNAHGAGVAADGEPLVVDGDYGPLTKRALQQFLGVKVDGIVGPITTRALQRYIGMSGTAVDGAWGPHTTTVLQQALNAGRF